MTNTTEAMREEFEAINPSLDYRKARDAWNWEIYVHTNIQVAWVYYQAAKATSKAEIDKLIAEAKQEQKEKDAGICDVIEMNGRGAKACSDAIRNQSEVSDPADLKRCCDVVDCTCSLDD